MMVKLLQKHLKNWRLWNNENKFFYSSLGRIFTFSKSSVVFNHAQTLIYSFQNISCLRFISMILKRNGIILRFQNISCLRFIKKSNISSYSFSTFQNISCLRFMFHFLNVILFSFSISKHFMFKVHKLMYIYAASRKEISKHFMFKVHFLS